MADTLSSHSYAIWDANSELTLCNVPWDSNYDNVVSFGSTTALDAYIDSIPNEDKRVITNASYVRANEPVMLEDPFNTVSLYNYLRVAQPPQETTPAEPLKHYYYFITQVTHISPNTTAVALQLDVMQTYFRAAKLGRCYVERGHVARAQLNSFRSHGARYLTEPEGLAVGEEYYTAFEHLAPAVQRDDYNVMVVSSISLSGAGWGTEDAPEVPTPTPAPQFGAPNGLDIRILNGTEFAAAMGRVSAFPWIAQGIISMHVIPRVQRYIPSFVDRESTDELPFGVFTQYGPMPDRELNFVGNWRAYLDRDSPATIPYPDTPYEGGGDAVFWNQFTGRYSRLKKFWTSPYTLVEITADSGNSLHLRPEYMASENLEFRERFTANVGALALTYYPPRNGYLGVTDNQDLFVITGAMPSVGFINDAGAAAVASGTYQRQYAQDAATMQLSNSLAAAGAARNLADASMTSAREQNHAGQVAARRSTNEQNTYGQSQVDLQNQYGWVSSVGGGVAGGALTGSIPGAVIGGVGGAAHQLLSMSQRNDASALQSGHNTRMTDISNDASSRSLNAAMAYSEEAQATNYALAKKSMSMNHSLAISSIEAQRQTAEMTPPSLMGQPGGDLGRMSTTGMGLRVKVKVPMYGRVQAIGEYWFRYGYAANRYMTPPRNLHVMSKFSYWKFAETTIIASEMPETFKNTIRGVLEKGVTIWRDPSDIGRIDPADNDEIVADYYGTES